MSVTSETLAPPAALRPLAWLRKNLFSNWFNALLTIFSLVFLYFALVSIVRWVFFTADWSPVTIAPLLFLVGQYPRDQLWRPALSMLLCVFLIGLSWAIWERYVKAFAIFLGALLGVLALIPLETPTITLGVRAASWLAPCWSTWAFGLGGGWKLRANT
jgi:general L-amino acid transport system permease protein